MTILIGSAMCIYCDFETVHNCLEFVESCFEFEQSFDTLPVYMNAICPKGRKINKGNIIFEEVELNE